VCVPKTQDPGPDGHSLVHVVCMMPILLFLLSLSLSSFLYLPSVLALAFADVVCVDHASLHRVLGAICSGSGDHVIRVLGAHGRIRVGVVLD